MKEIIIKLLEKAGMQREIILQNLEVPKDSSLGDFAFPCFALAKSLKKNPVEIAKKLASEISSPEIEKVEAKGPYLNFFINGDFLAKETIKEIEKEKNSYGSSSNSKKRIMVEYPSPNTNKPLHLGHLRNMAIGESVSRILEYCGNKVIRANLVNDRGVHICKSMLSYEKWGKGKTPKSENKKPDHFVGDYYVLFNKKSKENPNLEEEAQECLRKWEAGDKKTLALWKKMNGWAMEGLKETYALFGVKHDKEYFESCLYKKGKEIVELGLKKGIFRKREDDAIIVDLSKEGFGEKVLLRKDGTSVYITQDLYLAKLKFDEFKLDSSIYVVGNEQIYHFNVLFSILRKFGIDTSKLRHLSYGMVELPEGKMKSREGNVVDADDLILSIQSLAKEELRKRFTLSKKELNDRSLKIALAAIKYMLLKIDISKNTIFNPKEAIKFEGDTGPYLLYSYARAKSILRKAKYHPEKYEIKNLNDMEKHLVNQLSIFPEIVSEALKSYSPNIIANYAFQLSQMFNEFYHSDKVIGSEQEQLRLSLVSCFSQVLKNALFLLGIQVLEKM